MISSNTKGANIVSATRESIALGIVVERLEIDNPWQDYVFSPIAVIVDAPPMDVSDVWRELRQDEKWVHYHAGNLTLDLHAGETEGYRKNLSENHPVVYVVLTPGEEADDPEFLPFLVTVCPYEAESYTEDTDQIVEGVLMPPEVVNWVIGFIDRHHVDVVFKKRKKKAYDPRKGGVRSHGSKVTRQ
jgi:hypothetical protein